MAAFQVDSGGTLPTSLWAWYNFEANGNDEAAGGRNLTATGSFSFPTGKEGNCADAGSSNSANHYYYDAADIGAGASGAVSISGWFNVTTAPSSGNDVILFNLGVHTSGSTNDVCYVIKYFNDGGTLKVNFARLREGIAWSDNLYTQTLTTGTWYHFVLTYDGTNIRGYLNGSLVVGPTNVGSSAGNISYGRAIQIFARGGDDSSSVSNYASGKADMVGFWSKQLSSTEITDLYNSGNGNAYTSSVSVTANASVVAATFAAQVPSVSGAANVAQGTPPNATFSVPAASISGGANVSPSVLNATFSIPAVNVITPDALINASVLSATFSTPAPTPSGAANVPVGVLSATFSVPAFTVPIGYTHAAAVQVATFSTPAVTVTAIGNVTVASSVLTATFSTQAPTISAEINAIITPSALTATFSVQAPTITAIRNITVSASVVSATFTAITPRKVGGVWTPQPRATGVWTAQPRTMG